MCVHILGAVKYTPFIETGVFSFFLITSFAF